MRECQDTYCFDGENTNNPGSFSYSSSDTFDFGNSNIDEWHRVNRSCDGNSYTTYAIIDLSNNMVDETKQTTLSLSRYTKQMPVGWVMPCATESFVFTPVTTTSFLPNVAGDNYMNVAPLPDKVLSLEVPFTYA
jgi:hypothetical protein